MFLIRAGGPTCTRMAEPLPGSQSSDTGRQGFCERPCYGKQTHSPRRGKDGNSSPPATTHTRCLTRRPACAQCGRLTLSHPDFTVGPGISPSPGELAQLLPSHCFLDEIQLAGSSRFPSRALPPIGNWEDALPSSLTLPRRSSLQIVTLLIPRKGVAAQVVPRSKPRQQSQSRSRYCKLK